MISTGVHHILNADTMNEILVTFQHNANIVFEAEMLKCNRKFKLYGQNLSTDVF